ncbi:MAG TPA: hypothetical protein VLG50_02165 [Candidatus Saccharimonadales bacterium]|nr:hypothetical protein [Candidatus Saccharimonadales bacterium]
MNQFTGNQDVDYVILFMLDYRDMIYLSSINKYMNTLSHVNH